MLKHGYFGTPEYNAYSNAKGRCQNPTDQAYKWYGERGIEFRFESFEDFHREIGDRPTSEHSLDRIENEGHYEPGNIRWATKEDQARNKRTNLNITLSGVTKTLWEWCDEDEATYQRMHKRIQKYGWCHECAITKNTCEHHKTVQPREKSNAVLVQVDGIDTPLLDICNGDTKRYDKIWKRIFKNGWCHKCAIESNNCTHREKKQRKDAVTYTIQGVTKTLADWCENDRKRYTKTYLRISQHGWCPECAILRDACEHKT